MPAFRYLAVDAGGRRSRGTVEGGSARHAREQLRARGLTPLEVTPLLEGAGAPGAGARLADAELTLFLRLLASLLEAGLELEAALRASAAQATMRLRTFHEALLARVLQGMNLSEALAAVGGVPGLGIAAIAAGERVGQLPAVLTALAEHGERRARMRARIGLALLYPAILTVVSLGVALALVTYVVPEVLRVFEGQDRPLPLLTRLLLGLSEFLDAHGLWLAVALALVLGALWLMTRQAAGRRHLDALLMATPGLAALRRAVDRERFLDTLAMLLGGGVPLVDALRAGAAVLASASLRDQAEAAAERVERGRSLTDALGAGTLLGPVALQLVAAGEEGARLEAMLERAARLERDRLEQRLAVLLGVLEPALILLMGVLVLLIVLAILLPIFELNALIA